MPKKSKRSNGRKRGSKRKAQFRHCLRRALERFGLRLTENDIWDIRAMIEAGQSRCVHKQSLRVSHHLLEYHDIELIVVYDKIRKMVVTFLRVEDYDWER